MTRLHQQVLITPVVPPAGPSILAHTAKPANNNTTLTTDAIDTTGAGALLAFTRLGSSHSVTLLEDSASNSGWVHDGPRGSPGYKFMDVWHCLAPTTSSSHTVTATYDSSMGTNGTDLYFLAIGGVTAVDDKTADYKVTTTAPPWEASLTTSASGIIIAGLAILAAHYRPSYSLNSGWTIIDSPARIDGKGKTSAIAYQVTSAGTYTSSWSPSDGVSDYYAEFLIGFK